MKIAPELLNLHNASSWQQAFALNPQSLKKLLLQSMLPMFEILNAKGAFVSFFSNRDAINFFIGEELADPNLFQMLVATRKEKVSHELFKPSSNNDNFERIRQKAGSNTIDFCLLVAVNNTEHNIRGVVVFYGSDGPKGISDISASVSLFQQATVSALCLQKYKRLNQDRVELQELIANTHHHGIFVKDKDSRIVFANKHFLNNYPAHMQDKVIGYTTIEDYPEAQRKAFLVNDQKAFAEGYNSVVETIDYPSGERKVLETTKQKFSTTAGSEYILGISYNVTEQYKLIKLLQMKNADLDQVANMLATDLRSPANSMVKLIQWLEQDLSDVHNPDIDDNLTELKARASKVNRLLAALHKFCFAGRDKQKPTNIVLTTLVSDILSALGSTTTDKLETVIDETNIALPYTPFFTVLEAIIDNAIVHNDHASPKLTVEYNKNPDYHLITVKDNGSGFNVHQIGQVFNLFYSTKPDQDNMAYGTGLSLARKIVTSYGGSLEIDNSVSSGASLVIKWPIDTSQISLAT